MASLILLVGFLLNFAAFGNGLQCYTYTCSNQTGIPGLPIVNCSSPRAITCSKYEDHCMTQRLKTAFFVAHLGKYLYTIQERRACTSFMSGQCHVPDYICKQSNITGSLVKCDIGCCQGDLCNNGYIPPRAPEPKGSLSGSNLSCYSCATRDMLGIKAPTKDCDRPVNATCGTDRFRGMKQDRCMSVKAVLNIGGFYKEIVNLRGCSDPFYCNQDFACKSMNASGMMESCNMSCCFGKNCNGPGPIDKPLAPSGSDLSCYSCASKNNTFGLKVADADCKNPAKQTCSYTDLGGARLKHNRCWRMSIWGNDKHQKLTNIEYRNCSYSRFPYCNKDYVCNSLNRSGELKRCDISCCTGNYCNGNPVSASSSQVASVSTRALWLIGLATVVLVH